jgi:hypothetical protein
MDMASERHSSIPIIGSSSPVNLRKPGPHIREDLPFASGMTMSETSTDIRIVNAE